MLSDPQSEPIREYRRGCEALGYVPALISGTEISHTPREKAGRLITVLCEALRDQFFFKAVALKALACAFVYALTVDMPACSASKFSGGVVLGYVLHMIIIILRGRP